MNGPRGCATRSSRSWARQQGHAGFDRGDLHGQPRAWRDRDPVHIGADCRRPARGRQPQSAAADLLSVRTCCHSRARGPEQHQDAVTRFARVRNILRGLLTVIVFGMAVASAERTHRAARRSRSRVRSQDAPRRARRPFHDWQLEPRGQAQIGDALAAWTERRGIDVLLLQEVGIPRPAARPSSPR